jgi:hypothetical protein
MSWCWVAFLAEPPTGDELAGAVASATATDLDGRPAGLVAAWRRGRKPLRSAGRVDERVIDPAGPPAWVSLVLVSPEVAPLFDDPARRPSACIRLVARWACPGGGDDWLQARPSRLCHTTERRTGVDGEEAWRERDPTGEQPGPARAGRAGARGAARRRPQPVRAGAGPGVGQGAINPGPAAARPCRRGLVSGGVRPAGTAVSGGQRPRRGCAGVKSRSGRPNRLTSRTRSSATSPEPRPTCGVAASSSHQSPRS